MAQPTSAQLVDCRGAPRFHGEMDEPRAGLARGHIPGSSNLPFTELTDPTTGQLLTPAALRERIRGAGIDPERSIVASCGSGVSACVFALAVEVLRHADAEQTGPPVAIYDGSWAEWGARGM